MVPALPLLRSRRRLARSSTGVGVGLALGVLEEVSPGELDADEEGFALGSLLGWEDGLELGSLLGWEEGLELGSLLGWEEGLELGSLLGVAEGFWLGEGSCWGGGGTSQVSAAFLAASMCSVTSGELPLS